MDYLNILQWPGMALGLAGAPLVACRSDRLRLWGFAAWLASNACWIVWATNAQAWGLLAMQSVFCLTSAQGVWNHLPRRTPPRAAAG